METAQIGDLEARVEHEFDRLYARLRDEELAGAARWGGFFRRSLAFLIDMAVVCVFSLLLFYLIYVGYRVGMTAHRPWSAVTAEMEYELVRFVAFAWIVFTSAYFVVLHTMDGRTVGKWLFGLRVVNARREAISYRQALGRWLAAVVTAPLVIGFLRILWHREKKGWHDSLARTWVIRE